MSGTKDATIRPPAFAGMFYPADPQRCVDLASGFVKSAPPRECGAWRGGIVPHAGWVCSGAIAGQTIAAIAASSLPVPDVVVVFGAVHTPIPLHDATLDTFAQWDVPGSTAEIAGELRAKLLELPGKLFRADDRFHSREHAVEVELPLIAIAWPGAAILPVEVPLIDASIEIGQETARALRQAKLNAIFLASSDLTHYGPAYGFAPAGIGTHGLEWAMQNDRRLLDALQRLEIERVVSIVRSDFNACGGGAIAAMLSACREFALSRVELLRHTNSFQTLAEVAPQPPENAVGYAAVVAG